MKGCWEACGLSEFVYRTDDGAVHIRVRNDGGSYCDEHKPWLVYTQHTEGNDRFATADAAKAHGVKRLLDLLSDTESLRDG